MFEFLSHGRIRQQLENLKERHPQMSQYQNFEDIPERLRVTARIRAWMAFGARGFEWIPERYLRDSMIFQGIYEKRLHDFSATAFKTARYKQMLLFSAWSHSSGACQIPLVYLTPSTLKALARLKNNRSPF